MEASSWTIKPGFLGLYLSATYLIPIGCCLRFNEFIWSKRLATVNLLRFRFMDINPDILPKVISSAEVYGRVQAPNCFFSGVSLGGILGDQQAALVGQTWDTDQNPSKLRPRVKVTYGTGAFLLWDIGHEPSFSQHGLLTTIAYQMGRNAKLHYALEVCRFMPSGFFILSIIQIQAFSCC